MILRLRQNGLTTRSRNPICLPLTSINRWDYCKIVKVRNVNHILFFMVKSSLISIRLWCLLLSFWISIVGSLQISFFPVEKAFALRYQTAGMLESVLRQGVLGEDDTEEESPKWVLPFLGPHHMVMFNFLPLSLSETVKVVSHKKIC